MSEQRYEQIELERHDKVALLRLNRPDYRNAQSRVMIEELNDAFADADNDTSIRAIVLAGAGEHFSSGHDLGTPEEKADREALPFGRGTLGQINRSWHLMVDSSLRWRDVKKPTIAAVQNAHSSYMMMELAGTIRARKDDPKGELRLGGMAKALARDQNAGEEEGAGSA